MSIKQSPLEEEKNILYVNALVGDGTVIGCFTSCHLKIWSFMIYRNAKKLEYM